MSRPLAPVVEGNTRPDGCGRGSRPYLAHAHQKAVGAAREANSSLRAPQSRGSKGGSSGCPVVTERRAQGDIFPKVWLFILKAFVHNFNCTDGIIRGFRLQHIPPVGEAGVVDLQDKPGRHHRAIFLMHRVGQGEQEFLLGRVVFVEDEMVEPARRQYPVRTLPRPWPPSARSPP